MVNGTTSYYGSVCSSSSGEERERSSSPSSTDDKKNYTLIDDNTTSEEVAQRQGLLLPSSSSYKKSSSEIQLHILSNNNDNDDEENNNAANSRNIISGSTTYNNVRKACSYKLLVGLCVFVVIGCMFLVLFPHMLFEQHSSTSKSNHNGSGGHDVVDTNTSSGKGKEQGEYKYYYNEPFSTLDPVKDLGLSSVLRPVSSQPPYPLLGDDDDNSSKSTSSTNNHYPTNSWYQNFLLPRDEPDLTNRVYTVPYIIDVVGPTPGIRVHPNHIDASNMVIQVNIIQEYGLTLGATTAETTKDNDDANTDGDSTAATTATTTSSNDNEVVALTKKYRATHMTPLGVTLEWDSFPMYSSITKGMPYATMRYESIHHYYNNTKKTMLLLPSIVSQIGLLTNPIVDGDNGDQEIKCNSNNGTIFTVNREIEVVYQQSDFTWLIFVSEPVDMKCITEEGNGKTTLQVVNFTNKPTIERDLIIRIALSKMCTTGTVGSVWCHQEQMHPTALLLGQGHYDKLLRLHSNYYPGTNTSVRYYSNNDNSNENDDSGSLISTKLIFDWNVQDMSNVALFPFTATNSTSTTSVKDTLEDDTTMTLLAFALPHHYDIIAQTSARPPTDHDIYCVNSLIGPSCLYEGNVWELIYDIPSITFIQSSSSTTQAQAQTIRPPSWSIPNIIQSLKHDIQYTLPTYYQYGAGDTYFSGKMLAKLSRILLIHDEIHNNICSTTSLSNDNNNDDNDEYKEVCNGSSSSSSSSDNSSIELLSLPSNQNQNINDDFNDALEHLKHSVEIWINGTSETPFIYDDAWGGMVSCGCYFDDQQEDKFKFCDNVYPNCPALIDPGMNFGNGFYNDVHFHYGYMVYACAVISKYDPTWAIRNFENVLLFIRMYASPMGDKYFTSFRHKDWFNGHSWASGIAMTYLNGKNQESSSEAIASYEAVALYGTVMKKNFINEMNRKDDKNNLVLIKNKVNVATNIERTGQILTATELRSTKMYWHVEHYNTKDDSNDKNVVDITTTTSDIDDDETSSSSSSNSISNNGMKIYPNEYVPNVIGMLWQTMAQCQTWFGSAQYLAYGIQLLPLTSISDQRDTIKWSKSMYHKFATSCSNKDTKIKCLNDGWYVLQLAMLARVGHTKLATKLAIKELSSDIFDNSAGGNGHSLSNTLWYIATRQTVKEPLELLPSDYTEEEENKTTTTTTGTSSVNKPNAVTTTSTTATHVQQHPSVTNYCNQPTTCTDYVLDTIAGLYTCRQRMDWLIQEESFTEIDACYQISVIENPIECGMCDPYTKENEPPIYCPDCTPEECNELNLCPLYKHTYVCTEGFSRGGCRKFPWTVPSQQCNKCCELTNCSSSTITNTTTTTAIVLDQNA